MTNEVTIGMALVEPSHRVYPALVCGDKIGGLICWLVIFTMVSLLLAAFSMRRSLILEPTGIINPIAQIRIAGILLAATGVAWIWEMYGSVVFALFILATDMGRESKESFLLGIFQMPRLFLATITALFFIWAVLVAILNRLKRELKIQPGIPPNTHSPSAQGAGGR